MKLTYLQPMGGMPDKWQFKIETPDELGWPSNYVVVSGWDEQHWIECDPAFIEPYCVETLTKYESLQIIPPTAEELAKCVSDHSMRCHVSEVATPQDGWVMVRACNDSGCSEWSNAKALPEPGLVVGLAIGFILLSQLRKISSPRTPARRRRPGTGRR